MWCASHPSKLSAANDVSYDPLDHSEATPASPSTYLAGPESACPEAAYIAQTSQAHNHSQLRSALQKLDSRSMDIIQKRWLAEHEQKHTLHDLAKTHGVSAERPINRFVIENIISFPVVN